MRIDDMNDTDSISRKVKSREKLLHEVRLLEALIEDTQLAEPINADVMTLRKIYRGCLDWRLEEMNPTSHPSLTGTH